MAQPSARGEEASAHHRICPRPPETSPALSRVDQADPGELLATPIRPRRSYGGRLTRWPPRLGKPSSVTIVLIERIIAQTERRVLHGEAVAANEIIVSLFKPHADIIGGRDVQYGHKLNLTTGRTGLIVDLVIEAGNPADSERSFPCSNVISPSTARRPDRHPPMAASPAATASRRRRTSAFTTRRLQESRAAVIDLFRSNWVYRKLRNFRVGIGADRRFAGPALYGRGRRDVDRIKVVFADARCALQARLTDAVFRLSSASI